MKFSKGEKTLLVVLSLALLFLGMYAVDNLNLLTKNREKQTENINMQSQCFTNLQPSRYFHGQVSPISLNTFTREVTIDFMDDVIRTSQVSNTGSMRPAIPDYAEVLVIKPNKEDIKVGDIITFDCDNKNIMHRVINITEDRFITKGDNNRDNDEISFGCNVTFDKIIEKTVGVLY